MPITLVSQSKCGSSTDGCTPVHAARCTTTSAPFMARAISLRLRTSPLYSATARLSIDQSVSSTSVTTIVSKSFTVPTLRLSNTLMPPAASPDSRNRAIKERPMNPHPPVISHLECSKTVSSVLVNHPGRDRLGRSAAACRQTALASTSRARLSNRLLRRFETNCTLYNSISVWI